MKDAKTKRQKMTATLRLKDKNACDAKTKRQKCSLQLVTAILFEVLVLIAQSGECQSANLNELCLIYSQVNTLMCNIMYYPN